MNNNKCAVIIAYGNKAIQSAKRCISGIKKHSNIPIVIISNTVFCDEVTCIFDNPGYGARLAKLSLFDIVPMQYRFVLYLDADTEPIGDISIGFDVLYDGFDIALSPSINQGIDVFSHIKNKDEVKRTHERLFNPFPLQLQAGVMFLNRTNTMLSLFNAWRDEWSIFGRQDQAALLRALEYNHVKMWILSNEWNNGSIIRHHFGEAKDDTYCV